MENVELNNDLDFEIRWAEKISGKLALKLIQVAQDHSNISDLYIAEMRVEGEKESFHPFVVLHSDLRKKDRENLMMEVCLAVQSVGLAGVPVDIAFHDELPNFEKHLSLAHFRNIYKRVKTA